MTTDKTMALPIPAVWWNRMSFVLPIVKTLTLICLLIGELFISSAARTHVIYWDPENVIFHASPAPLLHVAPRDEVVFVCSHQSLYILWTYERLAMESCSMWLDSRVIVRLLFKCPSTSNHSRTKRSAIQIKPNTTTLDNMRIHFSPTRFIQRNQTAQSVFSSDRIHGRWPADIRNKRQADRLDFPKIKSSSIENLNPLSSINSPDRFTLLIDEFSWVNGNPRFTINRPVFFMAQSSLCRANNMRLAIVNGAYRWDAEPTPLKSNREVDQNQPECDTVKGSNRDLTNTAYKNCDSGTLKTKTPTHPTNWPCSKPSSSFAPRLIQIPVNLLSQLLIYVIANLGTW